jgi:hypothetical protein
MAGCCDVSSWRLQEATTAQSDATAVKARTRSVRKPILDDCPIIFGEIAGLKVRRNTGSLKHGAMLPALQFSIAMAADAINERMARRSTNGSGASPWRVNRTCGG